MAWYTHTPTNLSWFWRGTQSAIFYYLACTPCLMHSARVKQRKENKRAMAERDQQMRLAEGMFYAQPLPFQTNEAWRSEIELGPERPNDGNAPMEPLWGITDGFGPPERLNECADPEPVPAWYVKRNPEVNDLHPPVASALPKSKKEALWMLQPPPPAAFMEGRVTTRSRAATATTRSTSRSTAPSSRPHTRRGRAQPGRSPLRRHDDASKQRSSAGRSTSSRDISRQKRRPAPLVTIGSDEL